MLDATVREKIMRVEFVQVNTRKEAEKQCPWAARIMKVEGGYRCFESVVDYETARNQK